MHYKYMVLKYLCDTNLCDYRLTRMIRINELLQKMSLYGIGCLLAWYGSTMHPACDRCFVVILCFFVSFPVVVFCISI